MSGQVYVSDSIPQISAEAEPASHMPERVTSPTSVLPYSNLPFHTAEARCGSSQCCGTQAATVPQGAERNPE